MSRIVFRTFRKPERVRVRKTGATGSIAAVNDNCIVVWLDDGSTLHLEPVDADFRLDVIR